MNKIDQIPKHFPISGRIIGYEPNLAFVDEDTDTVYLRIFKEDKLKELKEEYPDLFKGKLKKGEYSVVANKNNPLFFIFIRTSNNMIFINTQALLQQFKKDNDKNEEENMIEKINFFLDLCKKNLRR